MKATIKTVIVHVFMIYVAHVCLTSALDCQKNIKDARLTNGCSVPREIKVLVPYKRLFINSCNLHDLCYTCGKSADKNRLKCDNLFRKNMHRACSAKYKRRWEFLAKHTCKTAGDAWYAGVRAGGIGRFDNPSPEKCHQAGSWVQTCLKSV